MGVPWKRIGTGIATGGWSEAGRAAYNKLYRDPAQQQKRALDAAGGRVSDMRKRIDQRIAGQRHRAHQTYSDADMHVRNSERPTFLTKLYEQRSADPRKSRLEGIDRGSYSSPLQQLWQSGTMGARPTQVEERYNPMRLQEGRDADKNIGDFISGLGETGVPLRSRIKQRGAVEDTLTKYWSERRGQAAAPVETHLMMGDVGKESGRIAHGTMGHVDSYQEAARSKDFADKYTPTKAGILEQFVAREMGDGSEGQRVFDRLADQTQKRVQRASAARGGFVTGTSALREGEALAELGGHRYAQLTDMAERGQRMELDRLGLGFGMQQGIDRMGLDKLGLSLRARESAIGAATAADTTKAGLAKATDETRTTRQGQLDSLAGITSAAEARRAEALDALNRDLAVADRERESLVGGLSKDRDIIKQTERRTLDELAGAASDSAQGRDRLRLDTAKGASDEVGRERDADIEVASGVDDFYQQYDEMMTELAGKATAEQRQNIEDKFDGLMKLADAHADADGRYDDAELRNEMVTMLEEIQLELTKAGIDAATAQAFVNNLMQAAGIGVKAYGAANGVPT